MLRAIWFAVVWAICLTHNSLIFTATTKGEEKILETITISSWQWIRALGEIDHYPLSLWCMNPRACIGLL